MRFREALLFICIIHFVGCGEGPGSSSEIDLSPAKHITKAGDITEFLWKPKSDSKNSDHGTLAILVDACNVDIRVNGESLAYSGPSNGRCTSVRGDMAGCKYGIDVTVEVFDITTGNPYFFPSGDPYYVVTNGCNREEIR